jgi:protein-disulfide isomerase
MKRPSLKVILPVLLVVLVVIVLTATGHIPPRPPSDGSPLKIIIYTDFLCGACKQLRLDVGLEAELGERYVDTGKAQIEIRLLAAMDPVYSMQAAQAALCAGDQGKFSEYTDALFSAYSEQEDLAVFSVESLTDLAAGLGLDEAAFASCFNTGARAPEIEENMNMAQANDVDTLPTVFIGDYRIEGRQPLDTYIQAVEETLATRTP